MYLRHQAYTLYCRHACIPVILHVFVYYMLLRCMLKFKRLACGSEDVTQYNAMISRSCSQAKRHENTKPAEARQLWKGVRDFRKRCNLILINLHF